MVRMPMIATVIISSISVKPAARACGRTGVRGSALSMEIAPSYKKRPVSGRARALRKRIRMTGRFCRSNGARAAGGAASVDAGRGAGLAGGRREQRTDVHRIEVVLLAAEVAADL